MGDTDADRIDDPKCGHVQGLQVCGSCAWYRERITDFEAEIARLREEVERTKAGQSVMYQNWQDELNRREVYLEQFQTMEKALHRYRKAHTTSSRRCSVTSEERSFLLSIDPCTHDGRINPDTRRRGYECEDCITAAIDAAVRAELERLVPEVCDECHENLLVARNGITPTRVLVDGDVEWMHRCNVYCNAGALYEALREEPGGGD